VARYRRFDVVVAGPATTDEMMDAVRARRAGMRVAMAALEHAAMQPSTDRVDEWALGVRDALDSVRDVVDHHIFATEAPGGFLDEIVGDEPRLANEAHRLREEHGEMVDAISAAAARLRARPAIDVDEWTDAMRDRVCALVALLTRHRQRGADLVYEAYDVDLGGGG
jgi:hypothetical protein